MAIIEIEPNYKKTTIGIIPKDWEVKKLVSQVYVDKENISSDFQNEFIEYVSLSDIENGRILPNKIEYNTAPSRARRITHKGDVLLATVRPNLKNFAIVDREDIIVSTGFAVLGQKKMNLEFLYNFLYSHYAEMQYYALTVGSNYPALNSNDVKNLKLPVPPLPEQEAIADCLSTWDRAIEKQTKLIKAKKQLKKGLMQGFFNGSFTVKDNQIIEAKEGEDFTKDWEEQSFEKLLKREKRNEEWDDNKLYKLISVRRRSGGIFHREDLLGKEIKVKNLTPIKRKDFLISKMQIVHGASALVDSDFVDFYVSGSYIILRVKDNSVLLPEFLNYYSKTAVFYHQTYVSSYGVHIEKMTFDFKTFLKKKMKYPTAKTQRGIVKSIQAANKEIKLLECKLDQLQLQKKGLMQVLLTGKKRLV